MDDHHLQIDASLCLFACFQAAQHRSLLGEGEFSDKRSRNDSFHETDSKVFADGFQSMDCDQRNMNDSDLEKHFANQGEVLSPILAFVNFFHLAVVLAYVAEIGLV